VKHLMISTALASAMAFGATAQTAMDQNAETARVTGSQVTVPAFLASNFTGMTLHALDSDAAFAIQGNRATTTQDGGTSPAERDRLRWTSSDTFLAERESWERVGSIKDIVMTKDGDIRGVLVDVGGFLGMFAHTVMVDIDELYFVTEQAAPEDVGEFFVVIAMSREQLESLPEWDDEQLRIGFDASPYRQEDVPVAGGTVPGETMPVETTPGDTAAAPAPTLPPETQEGASALMGDDYLPLEEEERTAERLIGADVLDATGEVVGEVADVVIGDDNRITDILVDVGGFLGVGAHTVKLPIEEAEIGWRDADDAVRVQLSMVAEQLESLPAHDG